MLVVLADSVPVYYTPELLDVIPTHVLVLKVVSAGGAGRVGGVRGQVVVQLLCFSGRRQGKAGRGGGGESGGGGKSGLTRVPRHQCPKLAAYESHLRRSSEGCLGFSCL